MNSYAAWASSDVKVSGTYTLTALSTTTFANYTTNSDFIAGGLNQLKTDVPVTGLTVTGAGEATSVVNGGTLQMSATATPSGATNTAVTWSVPESNTVATIDADGKLTAIGTGTVVVTATAKDGSKVSGTETITVTAVPVLVNTLSITGANSASSVAIGSTLQMAATTNSDATTQTVTWDVATASGGVATIDSNGKLTPSTAGTVTVTATATDSSKTSKTATITIYSAAGFIPASGYTTTTTLTTAITSSKASTTNILIPFCFSGNTIKEVLWGAGGALDAAQYGISGNNIVLYKNISTNTIMTASTGTKTITVTLSNNAVYTFTLNVTA
jgi:hypothetical protein